MPPTNTPGAGAGASSSAGQPTLPARDAGLTARDLDPDFDTASTPVDMSRTYDGDRSGAGVDVGQMKDQARETVRETYDQVRQFTNEALDKARQQWSESRGRITERAQGIVDSQKERFCKGIDDAAQAAHAAAERLEERDDPTVASYAHAAARTLEHARDYLSAARVDDLMDDARGFARRHPEWILGGMFVAGLAVARFLKANRMASRGRPPHGADEGLYRDIYESQFEGSRYGARAGWNDDWGDDYGDSGYAVGPRRSFEQGFGYGRGTHEGVSGTDFGAGTYGTAGTYDTEGRSAGRTRSDTGIGDDVLSDMGRSAGLGQPGTHAGDQFRSPTSGGSTSGDTGSSQGGGQ